MAAATFLPADIPAHASTDPSDSRPLWIDAHHAVTPEGNPVTCAPGPCPPELVTYGLPEYPVVGGGEIAAAQLSEYLRAVELDHYVQALKVAAIVDYVKAEEARQAAEAELERERTQYRAPSTGYSAPGPGGATGACGGATNGADQYIWRESRGDPNAYNPSGAWGCYQIMPGTWAGAGCDEFGAYGSADADAQAKCASRLPDSAWAL